MSWIELDDQILEHPKFIRAVKSGGADALHLWIGLRAYCSQKLTDGLVPTDMLDEVRGPRDPKKRAQSLGVLRAAGLLDEHADGIVMHDYLDWSSSRDEVLGRREKARERKARSRTPSRRDSQSDGERDSGSDSERSSPAVTNPRGRVSSASSPSEEETPTPSTVMNRKPPRDLTMASLGGQRTQDDPGVVAVFEAWKLAHGRTGSKFRQPADHRADTLFEAIQTHDVVTCLRVIEASKTDPKVLGKTDERGEEHRSIEYLFKPETFDRLLAAAMKTNAAKLPSVAEAVRIARGEAR